MIIWIPAQEGKKPGDILSFNCPCGFQKIVELEHEEAEQLMPLADEIRILCPQCKKYTLKLEERGYWD
jgi:hypothetical protein